MHQARHTFATPRTLRRRWRRTRSGSRTRRQPFPRRIGMKRLAGAKVETVDYRGDENPLLPWNPALCASRAATAEIRRKRHSALARAATAGARRGRIREAPLEPSRLASKAVRARRAGSPTRVNGPLRTGRRPWHRRRPAQRGRRGRRRPPAALHNLSRRDGLCDRPQRHAYRAQRQPRGHGHCDRHRAGQRRDDWAIVPGSLKRLTTSSKSPARCRRGLRQRG